MKIYINADMEGITGVTHWDEIEHEKLSVYNQFQERMTNEVLAACNGANDGSIDVIVEGGTGIYTYQWSNGETTQNISDVIAGSYDLLVIDENECTASIAVEITEPNKL